MKVAFPRVRLPLLAHILIVAIFGILVGFSVVGGPIYGPAFIGVAGAWGVGVLAIDAPLASDAYRKRVQRKLDLEVAYSALLPLADEYAKAWDRYNETATEFQKADNEKNVAEKRLELHYNAGNKRALDDADKALLNAGKSFHTARDESDKRCAEYSAARDNVNRLAPGKVRTALDEFDKSITKETAARARARSGFVTAVRADLHQPRWPDPDS